MKHRQSLLRTVNLFDENKKGDNLVRMNEIDADTPRNLRNLLSCFMSNEKSREMVVTTLEAKDETHGTMAPLTACVRIQRDGFLVRGVWDFVSSEYVDIGAIVANGRFVVYAGAAIPNETNASVREGSFTFADQAAGWIHRALERCAIQSA